MTKEQFKEPVTTTIGELFEFWKNTQIDFIEALEKEHEERKAEDFKPEEFFLGLFDKFIVAVNQLKAGTLKSDVEDPELYTTFPDIE